MLERLNQEDLCKQFCADVKLHRRTDDKVMLETPFSFPDGDQYALYLEETRTGGIRLSDGGSTLIQLSYENDTDKLFEGARSTLFEQIIGEQGVQFDNDSGQFFLETNIQDLSRAAFQLGQAMTRVHDLSFLNRSRVASTFYDDLKEHLCDLLPRENVKQNYIVSGLPNSDHYPVDFCFEGKAGAPVFLFGIPNRDKARLATICLQYFLQNKVDFESVLVFQNQEEIPRGDLSRLSNVGGEQISSLNAEDDFRRKILRKAA
jgi:hypothetical protein